jgi:type II secretion system protein N
VRRGLAIALGCALLTAFFFAVRFPYDRFREGLVAQLRAATGAEVQMGALSGGLGLGGITLVAEPVSIRWPGGMVLALDRAALRPAWSYSWLLGKPAVHVDLRAPVGRLDGTLWPAPPLAFEGSLHELVLEQLPPEVLAAAQGFAVTGRLDADADLAAADGALGGELSLDVREGALSAPGSPISIPFDRLRAELALEPGGAVRLDSASLEGPMVGGSAKGQLGLTADPTESPIDLEVDMTVVDPSLRSTLAPLGVRIGPDGKAKLQLRGTLGSPILR